MASVFRISNFFCDNLLFNNFPVIDMGPDFTVEQFNASHSARVQPKIEIFVNFQRWCQVWSSHFTFTVQFWHDCSFEGGLRLNTAWEGCTGKQSILWNALSVWSYQVLYFIGVIPRGSPLHGYIRNDVLENDLRSRRIFQSFVPARWSWVSC